MKLNKMISTFCAACMLLTALSATYALDNADPISEYAGSRSCVRFLRRPTAS